MDMFLYFFLSALALLVLVFSLIRLVVCIVNLCTPIRLPIVEFKKEYEQQISLLIPVRNEAHNLPSLFQLSLLSNPAIKEVIFLDDHSSDDTALLIQRFQQQNSKVKLFSGQPLPEGWLGKNWACHQLAQQATGSYLFFMDADVSPQPALLDALLNETNVNSLTLLSVFPDQTFKTWGERLIVPLMHYFLLSLLPLILVRKSRRESLAAANGQVMFFNSTNYKTYWFHQLAKDQVVEDVFIMRKVKALGLRGGVYLANGLVQCRMYQSWQEASEGFSKNLFPGFNKSLPAMVAYFVLITVGWLSLAYFLTGFQFLLILLIPVFIRISISWMANQAVGQTLLLHPLQLLAFVHIGILSYQKHLTKSVTWKGRQLK